MITVRPVEPEDVPALATIRRDAFASTVISQLISGTVDPAQRLESGIKNLSVMLEKPRRTLRKAVRDEAKDGIVGLSIFDLVDTTVDAATAVEQGRSAGSDAQDRPEPPPGTNSERLNEFVAMLDGMLEQYKSYDPRFYSTFTVWGLPLVLETKTSQADPQADSLAGRNLQTLRTLSSHPLPNGLESDPPCSRTSSRKRTRQTCRVTSNRPYVSSAAVSEPCPVGLLQGERLH